MIAPLLAAALLAAPAFAADKIQIPCAQDEMSREWQAKSFVLWLANGTNPDAEPRTATLKFKKCEHVEEISGEPITPRDERWYVSDDGSIGVIATADDAQPGATYLTLVIARNGALTNAAQLGAWAHRKVFYKGVGVDKVSIADWRNNGAVIVKNVFVIPSDAVISKP